MSAGPLSTNPKANKLITEDYVKEAILKDKGPEAKFKAFEIIDFCTKGDNYACFVTSVKVNYLQGAEEKSVTYVAKLNHCHGIESVEMFTESAFKKEGNFYLRLVPELNGVMQKLGLPSLKFATCFFTSFEPTRQVILLGDKREDSFKMANRHVGLDEHHVKTVLTELARLHAASVILEDNMGTENFLEKFDFLEDFFTNEALTKASSIFKDMFIGHVANGANIAKQIEGYEKVSAWLTAMAPTSFDLLKTQTEECDPKFRVINHGDCWNNNLLFRYDEGKVADVCLLDLQINRHASLALDLNYFLFTSLNGDTRKKNMTQLLTTYYDAFKGVFDAAKKSMKFTFDELVEEFRNKNGFGLVMALMVIPVVVMQSTDVPDFEGVSEENMQEKMAEFHEKVFAMIDTNPILRPRLLDMLDEMVENGTIKIS